MENDEINDHVFREDYNLCIGDIYFNSGDKPCLVAPTYNILNKALPIAENKKEARRWLTAKLLVRDIKAYNIVCVDNHKCPTYNILTIKSYHSGIKPSQLMLYPQSQTGYFQVAYPVNRICTSCNSKIGKDPTLRIYKKRIEK